jgi:hypothetical protein
MRLMDATLQVGVPIQNVAEWCRANGVNERTFYRHRARVAAEGAWTERSRRPLRSPTGTDAWLVAGILALCVKLKPDNGADNILADLLEQAQRPDWPARLPVPSRATINRILGRHDLLVRNPKKRPKSSWRRFAYARPRDCFQIDGTECLQHGRRDTRGVGGAQKLILCPAPGLMQALIQRKDESHGGTVEARHRRGRWEG